MHLFTQREALTANFKFNSHKVARHCGEMGVPVIFRVSLILSSNLSGFDLGLQNFTSGSLLHYF